MPSRQGTPRSAAAPRVSANPARAREVFHVDWPLFGELSRALALRVAREFEPDVVVGIATAGVVPGAVVAAILDRPFRSMIVSRRYMADSVRDTPAVLGAAPAEVRGRRVLVVDETCDSGETMRLAVAAVLDLRPDDDARRHRPYRPLSRAGFGSECVFGRNSDCNRHCSR